MGELETLEPENWAEEPKFVSLTLSKSAFREKQQLLYCTKKKLSLSLRSPAPLLSVLFMGLRRQ